MNSWFMTIGISLFTFILSVVVLSAFSEKKITNDTAKAILIISLALAITTFFLAGGLLL